MNFKIENDVPLTEAVSLDGLSKFTLAVLNAIKDMEVGQSFVAFTEIDDKNTSKLDNALKTAVRKINEPKNNYKRGKTAAGLRLWKVADKKLDPLANKKSEDSDTVKLIKG
mgnify:CR=1 FL=1